MPAVAARAAGTLLTGGRRRAAPQAPRPGQGRSPSRPAGQAPAPPSYRAEQLSRLHSSAGPVHDYSTRYAIPSSDCTGVLEHRKLSSVALHEQQLFSR